MKKQRFCGRKGAAWTGLLLAVLLLTSSCTGAGTTTLAPTEPPTAAPTEAPTAAPTEAPTEPQPTEPDYDYPTDGSFYLKPGMKVGDVDVEVVKKVIQETALAYYYKNPDCQYDVQAPHTVLGTVGSNHLTPRQSPEETTPETPYFAVCRSLPPDIYWDAFNFKTPGIDATGFGAAIDPETAVYEFGTEYKKYAGKKTQCFMDKEEFMAAIKAGLQPGDVILATKNDGTAGHVLLFIGDCFGDGENYVIHSWPVKGGKWDQKTGVEKWEPTGAARLQRAEDIIYDVGPSPNWALNQDKMDKIVIIRFLDNAKFLKAEFTDAAVTRYNKQGLEVTKTSTSDVYDTVLTGEEITITEELTNHSAAGYVVTVVENIAEGTAFVSSDSTGADKGKSADGTVTWTVEVPAGGTVSVSYTVKVTAAGTQKLVFPAGAVSSLPTRAVQTTVGKSRLTDAEAQKLLTDAETAAQELVSEEFADLNFVNLFYEKLFGVKTALPENLSDYLTALYDVKKPVLGYDYFALVRKKEPDQVLTDYIIPRCELGYYYHNQDYVKNFDRILYLKEEYFEPGDVLIEMHGANLQRYSHPESMSVNVYLGNGQVLSYSMEGVTMTTFAATFSVATKFNYVVVLRPMNATER
ncbi:MAG: DUF11 domain-containing protein [Lachnospiraceae bacterium]|nr:DUF11 domain-containing protein [Lachnospiraceae bacterium]